MLCGPISTQLDAVNSLNQTVYFLRRVLEEDYVDDLSPGYFHHDSDLIWLDHGPRQRAEAMSAGPHQGLPGRCRPRTKCRQLVDGYTGRFALDFEYEEWAAPYRDWLHASFLEIVERAVSQPTSRRATFDRGISLARRVLDVDPDAEQVEVSLLRLYRAAEPMRRLLSSTRTTRRCMREQLGIEPPPLEAL